jgi:glycosyltransferase involved in cell wall biosynthesis
VPVKDRRERMLRCLDALLQQDHPSFEVLVLDNGSSDGTPDACAERAATSDVPVRVEVLSGTVGAIRNRAAELARGEVLAFTDSDCVPEPGWLTGLAGALNGRPDVGVACGATLAEEPFNDGWPATMEVTEWTGRYESCNIAFRRGPFAESAGFDEEVGHFWEDTAAGYAMRRGGWRAVFVPDAVVRHDVTYPGFWWHVRRQLKQANMGPVLARYPEIAGDHLWAGVFLSPREAKLVAALAGALLARRRPLALTLVLPYVQERLPPRVWGRPKAMAHALIYDGASVVGGFRAGLRARRLVL